MAPTQGRVAKPEQRWGYRHSSPAVTSYLLSIVTIELSLTVFTVLQLVTDSEWGSRV